MKYLQAFIMRMLNEDKFPSVGSIINNARKSYILVLFIFTSILIGKQSKLIPNFCKN